MLCCLFPLPLLSKVSVREPVARGRAGVGVNTFARNPTTANQSRCKAPMTYQTETAPPHRQFLHNPCQFCYSFIPVPMRFQRTASRKGEPPSESAKGEARHKGLKLPAWDGHARPPSLLKAALIIACKDLRAEMRRRETVSAMLVFALLAILLFSFALELDRTGRESAAAGVLWVTLIFAGALGMGHSLGREKDQGCLDGLLLAPVDRSALYFGKLIGGFVYMAVVAAVLLPLLAVLFNTTIFTPLMPVVLTLGVMGYAGVGTLLASMSAHTRSRDVLLPILLLPVALAILIPAVRATRGLLEGFPPGELFPWFGLLAATDAIILALAYMLFDYVVEE